MKLGDIIEIRDPEAPERDGIYYVGHVMAHHKDCDSIAIHCKVGRQAGRDFVVRDDELTAVTVNEHVPQCTGCARVPFNGGLHVMENPQGRGRPFVCHRCMSKDTEALQ